MEVQDSGAVPWWRRPSAVAALVLLGLELLTLTWVFSNPPGASPDEPAALVKALATAHSQVGGTPYRRAYPPYDGSAVIDRWMAEVSRSYVLPARDVPPSLLPCVAFRPATDAACESHGAPAAHDEVATPTPDGLYPPAVYFLLGMGARAGSDVAAATYGARLVSAALACGLLSVALWCACVGRRTWWPLVGMLLVTTPMVLFLTASVTTNGVEIAAAVCFWAALLRVRLPTAPARTWLAVGLGGAVMAVSRQLDDAWLLMGVAVLVCLVGPAGLRRSVRAGGWCSAVGIGVALAGALAGVAWDVVTTPAHALSLHRAARAAPTTRGVESLLHQAVGVFGWLDTPLPDAPERAWLAVVALLVGVATVKGSRRGRLGIGVAVAGLVIGTVGMQTLVLAQIGFGMQARYVLPMAVGVVLVALEVLDEHAPLAVASGYAAPAVAAVVALVQGVALDTNTVRYGVGLGTHRSEWTDPAWQPPGGTALWIGVALAGVGAMVLAGVAIALSASAPAVPPDVAASRTGLAVRRLGVAPALAVTRSSVGSVAPARSLRDRASPSLRESAG